MAKKKMQISYKCSQCGFTQPRWLGRCPECGAWNTLEECVTDPNALSSVAPGNIAVKVKPVPLASIEAMADDRISTGIEEFDRVLGGNGATKRSAVLLGGEPGIGKSTLLLQTASSFSHKDNGLVLYVSGEESSSQIKARANRLSVDCGNIQIMPTMRLEDILDALNELKPSLVIIDSIQTVYSIEGGIIPGTVNQLKYCANELTGWVKEHDSVLIMTCHVTKDGNIAGPKALEHMVDTVISFERNNDEIRFLRAYKNRFGSVDELGIFEMTEKGLKPVEDPSTMFITRREGAIP
ncbi:MAG: AAA family ATPase, partial [Treponema sp.]|nr:AAA family ATPase [Candidatus Treponema scatequi]